MPSVAYFTASAPFWDFIERLEASTDENNAGSRRRGGRCGGRRCQRNMSSEQNENQTSEGEAGASERRGCPRGERGERRGGPFGGRRGHHGPPPFGPGPHHWHGPFGHHGPHHGPPGEPGQPGEPEGPPGDARGPPGPPGDNQGPPPFGGPHGPHHHRGGHGHRHGPRDPFSFEHWGRGGFGGGWSPFGGHGGPRGPFGFPWMGNSDPNQELASRDFKPSLDLFTAPEAYTLHISLPGAKREDIGVLYDAGKSELVVSGVVHRAGDEEFLKTISSGFRERDAQTGVFERRVRFGNRRWAADVNEDAIAAKLEDGVLVVVVPRVQRDINSEKQNIPVSVEDEDSETEQAEKEALAEAEKQKENEMDIETETERGDVDGDTLYSRDEKRKSVAFEEDDSDDDFVDVKRVDVQ